MDRRSAEGDLAAYHQIIGEYRTASIDASAEARAVLRAEAFAKFRKLGVDEGFASRWLDAKSKRR